MRFYIIIGIIFSACTSNQNSNNATNAQAEEIRKMMAEDSFAIDTNIVSNSEDLSAIGKKSLSQIALRPLKPKYDIKELKIELITEVYKNILSVIKTYQDSDQVQQAFLNIIFEDIENQNKKLELEVDYPIELKLKVASIVSDIHLLRSKQILNSK